jgi:SHS2 domain-containing protein
LRELLYLFDAHRFLSAEFVIELQGDRLHARVRGEVIDPDRHQLVHEVKAITSHGLKLCKTASGYEAEFIADI